MSEEQIESPPYFFEKRHVLSEVSGVLGITYLSNVTTFMKYPQKYVKVSYIQFLDWNKKQKNSDAWWIETHVHALLKRLADLIGYDLAELDVFIPKKNHPLLFALDEMCFVVAPFNGEYLEINSLVTDSIEKKGEGQ